MGDRVGRNRFGGHVPVRSAAPGLLVVCAAAAAVGCGPSDVSGQTPSALADACETAGGRSVMCTATAVAARALLGDLGAVLGLGSEVPGTASNLGQRLGTTPRVALSLRAGGLWARLPDLRDASGLGEASFLMPTVHTGVTLGLFDGFRLMPTVGGFLSLDVFAQLSFVFLPESEGFEDATSAYSVGARVGILREGFTLPGVSVSVSRRFGGSAALGDTSAGDPAQLSVDPSVTSLRMTVGKDLFAVEVLAGFGWDDYSADATWGVSDGVGGVVTGAGSIDASRRLYFVSAARSFSIVFSLSVEGGIARGFDPVAGYTGAAFDPTEGSLFGSFAFRLTI